MSTFQHLRHKRGTFLILFIIQNNKLAHKPLRPPKIGQMELCNNCMWKIIISHEKTDLTVNAKFIEESPVITLKMTLNSINKVFFIFYRWVQLLLGRDGRESNTSNPMGTFSTCEFSDWAGNTILSLDPQGIKFTRSLQIFIIYFVIKLFYI